MNKKFLFLVIVMVMGIIPCTRSAAQENRASQSYWATENLRLRAEPTTNGRTITTMRQGTMVQRLETGAAIIINNIGGNWLRVQTETGERGWCFGGYLSTTRAGSYPQYWAIDNLRLREQPNTNGRLITTMRRGTMVQKLDAGAVVTINDITANWLYVQAETGERGWCFGGYLTNAREKSTLIGYWRIEEGNRIIFLHASGVYQSGILESSGLLGYWSYASGNNIRVDIINDHYEEVEDSFDQPFTILNNDRVRFGGTAYRRMTEQELRSYSITPR